MPLTEAGPERSASGSGVTLSRWTGSLRTPILWGVVVGVLQAFSPVGFWWLRPGLVWAISLIVIAPIYIGLAVADGRPIVIAVEVAEATGFVLIAAISVTVSPWLAVIGLVGHGLKDLYQHHSGFVANTRWWPPFCMVVDWVAAAAIAILLLTGVHLHG